MINGTPKQGKRAYMIRKNYALTQARLNAPKFVSLMEKLGGVFVLDCGEYWSFQVPGKDHELQVAMFRSRIDDTSHVAVWSDSLLPTVSVYDDTVGGYTVVGRRISSDRLAKFIAATLAEWSK